MPVDRFVFLAEPVEATAEAVDRMRTILDQSGPPVTVHNPVSVTAIPKWVIVGGFDPLVIAVQTIQIIRLSDVAPTAGAPVAPALCLDVATPGEVVTVPLFVSPRPHPHAESQGPITTMDALRGTQIATGLTS
jgi:hypothetical protein